MIPRPNAREQSPRRRKCEEPEKLVDLVLDCRRQPGDRRLRAADRGCERDGSLDSAIRAAVPNDLAQLKRLAPGLRAVAHNGAESARSRRITEALAVDVHTLPSTSPANAAWSFERKLTAWQAVFSRYDLAS